MCFDDINDALSSYPNLESPSFLQGMLTGLFCGKREVSESTWIKDILSEAGVKKVKEAFLKNLHELFIITENGLNSSDFEFELCLPDDDQEIIFRAALVAQWAEGFLYGFGLSKKVLENEYPDSKEFIQDLQDIARLDVTELNDDVCESESYLMEVIEFVRIGVLMVNEELNPKKGKKIPDANPLQPNHNNNITLH